VGKANGNGVLGVLEMRSVVRMCCFAGWDLGLELWFCGSPTDVASVVELRCVVMSRGFVGTSVSVVLVVESGEFSFASECESGFSV